MNMTFREFCRLQKAAGMTNKDVERLMGVSDQTVVNWRHGYTRIPRSVQVLIRQMAAKGQT
jgi:transcriptional regulator with XRE-family HTH domain